MAQVTVFVDAAVQGRLPGVCVVDGVDTADTLTVRQTVGDGARLGVPWLLVLAGPIGWIGLLVIAWSRAGRGEVLTVRLPLSEAAYRRQEAARRRNRLGVGAIALGVVLGLSAAVVVGWPLPLQPLLAAGAVVALAWGLITVVRSNLAIGRESVGIELDASRRWVTLSRVHPRFAAAADHLVDQPGVGHR